MDIKIVLTNSEIDLAKEIGFGLNYSIDDIRNIEKKNTNYSKTITLAGTDNNNKILGGLFDVNSDFTFFNPNLKTPAKIVVNSEVVIDGFLQLKSIETKDKIVYKCVINSNAVDFFSDIKDKKLSELDLSSYDHTYDKTNIENSWTNTRGYVYPLMFKDDLDYLTTDFKPAIFHKEYLKRIALEAGYSLGGSLMDETTEEGGHYAKEVIPYNGKDVTISDAELERRLFKVGQTSSIVNFVSNTIGSGQDLAIPTFRLEVLDNEIFDNGNVYSAYKYTIDTNGTYSVKFNFNGQIQFSAPGVDAYKSTVNPITNARTFGGNDYKATIQFRVYKNGALTGYKYKELFNAPEELTSSNGYTETTALNFYIQTPNLNLLASDEIEIKYTVLDGVNFESLHYTEESTGQTGLTPVGVNYKITSFTNGTTLENNTGGATLQDGDTIFLNNFIPKKVKQSDLIKDLIARKNLYISIDPDNEKKIILDTRDSYFAKGGSLDWSDKFDNDSKVDIKLISELQNKEYLFTYKEDKDDLNESYSDANDGAIWGEKEVIFNNDFVKGVKKIETPFSPTISVPAFVGGSNFGIVPSIPTRDPETNIRVLYYGGVIDCLNNNNWTFNKVGQTTYPYAGHLDNPINPSIDINFGESSVFYYADFENRTNANLYNRFWANYINQLATGKLVTMYLYLDTTDISHIRHNLNTKIYINNSYYYINKIIDYNPLKEGLTKVELLKIDDGIAFVGDTETKPVGEITEDKEAREKKVSKLERNQDDGINNTIKGEGNYISSEVRDASIIGKNNVVTANRAIVQGDDNFVSGEGSFVIGANNKEVTEANAGYLGDIYYVDGVIVENEVYSFSDIEALAFYGRLMKDKTYKAQDTNNIYVAKNQNELSLYGYKDVMCVKNSYYTSIGIFEDGTAYAANDLVVYGNRVWKALVNVTFSPSSFYLLSSDFELQTDPIYYEDITLRAEFLKGGSNISKLSDNRNNVVLNDFYGGFLYSDWNAPNKSNNVCYGFMNNTGDVNYNNCGLIANNIIDNVEFNKNNGDIVKNNGAVDIKFNVNNGNIGVTGSMTARGADVTDTIVNK